MFLKAISKCAIVTSVRTLECIQPVGWRYMQLATTSVTFNFFLMLSIESAGDTADVDWVWDRVGIASAMSMAIHRQAKARSTSFPPLIAFFFAVPRRMFVR